MAGRSTVKSARVFPNFWPGPTLPKLDARTLQQRVAALSHSCENPCLLRTTAFTPKLVWLMLSPAPQQRAQQHASEWIAAGYESDGVNRDTLNTPHEGQRRLCLPG